MRFLCSMEFYEIFSEIKWTEYISLAFSVFLILLAIYFYVFSERISLQATRKTAAVCAMISGITSGLFGIGGSLMAIYFISAIEDKKSYIAIICKPERIILPCLFFARKEIPFCSVVCRRGFVVIGLFWSTHTAQPDNWHPKGRRCYPTPRV